MTHLIDVSVKLSTGVHYTGKVGYHMGDVISAAFHLFQCENEYVSASKSSYSNMPKSSDLLKEFLEKGSYDLLSEELVESFYSFVKERASIRIHDDFYPNVQFHCEQKNHVVPLDGMGQIAYAVFSWTEKYNYIVKNIMKNGKIGQPKDKFRELPVTVTNLSQHSKYDHFGRPTIVFQTDFVLPDGDILSYTGNDLGLSVGEKQFMSFTMKDFRIINKIPTNIIMRPKIMKE